jgi:hypothetical protein
MHSFGATTPFSRVFLRYLGNTKFVKTTAAQALYNFIGDQVWASLLQLNSSMRFELPYPTLSCFL